MSIIKKKIKFKKDLAVPKIARFGEFRNRIPQDDRINDINMSNVNERQATPKTFLSKPIAKPVIENQPSMQKPKSSSSAKEKSKNSENKRYPVLVRKVKDDLKAVADTEKILKLLFKQPVQSILIEDLLANCPNLHKRFFRKYVSDTTEDMKGVTQIGIMQSIAAKNREKRSLRGNPLAFRSFPRMTVILKNLLKLRGLIDTGAEINVITKKIYASLPGLIITENPEIAIVSHSNHHIPFLGICEDVKVTVGNIEYDICIFVINLQTNHALVLGAPFIAQSKLNLAIEEKNGKQYATVISENSTSSAKFYTGPAEKRIKKKVSAMRSLN